MPVTEFDDLLRDQYEQGSFEYKPASWERLKTQLPEKKKPLVRRILWLPLAAAAAAIVGIIAVPFIQHNDRKPIAVSKKPNQQTASATVAISIPPTKQIIPSPALPAVPASGAAPASNAISSYHKLAPVTSQQPTTIVNLPIIVQNGPSDVEVNPIVTEPVTSEPVVINTQQNSASVAPVAVTAPPEFKRNTVALVGGRIQTTDGPRYEGEPRVFKSSSLSIAGGYKYGTGNMGYMVGVNGRKNIGEKVFLEGDLAFANSRNAQVTNQSTTDNFQQVKTIAGTNAIGARAVSSGEVISNMYYLQLTPTVGYQVYRTMSLGAGADIQRMFQNSESTSYVIEGNDVKALPQIDYGIVGKAEYSLTKTFKAGIQYRQGMNSVMAPDKNYLNRSYLQVQLKLGILGR